MIASRTLDLAALDGPSSIGGQIGRDSGLRVGQGRGRQSYCNCCLDDDAAYKISFHVSKLVSIRVPSDDRGSTPVSGCPVFAENLQALIFPWIVRTLAGCCGKNNNT